MDSATQRLLQSRTVLLPGGRDLEERPLIIVPLPLSSTQDSQQPNTSKDDLKIALQYILSVFSKRTKTEGLTVIIDAQRGSWRQTRNSIRQVTETFIPEELGLLIVLRPEAFWDKQRVDHCTRTRKDGQAIFIPRSRLHKYVEISQLPGDLGGGYIHNHKKWTENRMKVEEFVRDAKEALTDLEQLRQHLVDNRSVRVSKIERALSTSADMNDSTRTLVHSVSETGKDLLQKIEYENRNRKFDSEYEAMSTAQDTLDTIEYIESLLNEIYRMKLSIDDAWFQMEKSFADTKDISILEDGISRVINWILGPAETILNSQQRVGYDVISSEERRREHESLEMQCWNAYGQYAALLHKVDNLPMTDITPQRKDLISQRDFMDFVCRCFATRLEMRRNILNTSLKFFRLASEYFDRTSEVFESLLMGNKVQNFSSAGQKLKELQDNQIRLEIVERELVKEGEKLSDMLSVPVKDALGRDLNICYEEDIANIHDILDATISRKNIFGDSVELQKLTLQQITHISAYEKDVDQAIRWLDELFLLLITEYSTVGCNGHEIQNQKDDHFAFHETAKGTYNYGYQLLHASLSLRQACKLPLEDHMALAQQLKQCWQRLLTISNEQMTRLRVSAVFHRSIDDYCIQLRNLKEAIESTPVEDICKKRMRVKRLMHSREKLLVEVGRMMRLGKLLRTRLNEHLYISDDAMSSSDESISGRPPECPPDSLQEEINEKNAGAVESISERLAEVTGLAEQLDMALREAQEDVGMGSNSTVPIAPSIKKIFDGTAAVGEVEWSTGSKPSKTYYEEDGEEEFVTASECTYPQSRSSSFNTTSEGGHFSPWWEFDQKEPAEDVSKEKMVLAVGCPDLPPPRTVLKPSPEAPPGMVVHEVTETTHLKVQHCHTLGVSSFVLTSETVRDGKSDTSARKHEEIKEVLRIPEPHEVLVPIAIENTADDDDFIRRVQEVGLPCEEKTAWSSYYDNYIARQPVKYYI